MAERQFVSLTPLTEFRDTPDDSYLLGLWCCDEASNAILAEPAQRYVGSPWADPARLGEAGAAVNAFYERALPQLADRLNSLHGTAHGLRYWRMVLGPWLRFYLTILYERYCCIAQALSEHPKFRSAGARVTDVGAPVDTAEFIALHKDDAGNLLLYTRILQALGHNVSVREISRVPRIATTPSWSKRIIAAAKLSLRRATQIVLAQMAIGRYVVVQNAYFPLAVLLRIVFRSRLRVLPILVPNSAPKSQLNDQTARATLQFVPVDHDPFAVLFSNLFTRDIPQCFVEGFAEIGAEARARYPAAPAAILSANDWYFDEVFKQWAAESAEAGSVIAGVQHGGNYGIIDFLPAEQHEVSIADRYYSWGWERTDCHAKIIPMPAPKLVDHPTLDADNARTGILLTATSVPRYPFVLRMVPAQFANYLDWHFRFAAALGAAGRKDLRVRLHREDLGWGIAARWASRFSDVAIESWDISFSESLATCRIYVCDHLSTTFLEALAANKPTMLFWDRKANPLRSEAEPYFDELRRVGILLDSPEEAATAVQRAYRDVVGWWQDSTRQDVRRRFCRRFALTAPDAIESWVAELRDLARQGNAGPSVK